MIRGMCELTGKELTGEDYLRQCFKRVLFTARETVSNYRGFGSNISEILGNPQTMQTILDLCSEGAQALEKWIVGLKIKGVSLNGSESEKGTISMTVTCRFNDEDIAVRVSDGE